MASNSVREVVLIHGVGGSPRIWEAVEAELDHQHIPACAIGLQHGVPIADEAEYVAHILRDAGIGPALVVGHSMGGLVATCLAEHHRELVDRLILASTPPTTGSRIGAESAAERILRLPVVGPLAWRAVPRSKLRKNMQSVLAPGTELPEFMVDDLLRAGPRSLVSSGATSDYLAERPLAERVRRLAIPTDVIFGMQDSRVDPASLDVYRGLSNVTITQVDQAGHMVPWETPEAIAEVIVERW